MEPEYQLPDTEEAEFFILALSEIGEGKISGDRITSIDWSDIKYWIDVTGATISPGEAEALKTLSNIYVSQYYASMDSGCTSPNIEAPKDKEAVAGKIKNLFAMLRN